MLTYRIVGPSIVIFGPDNIGVAVLPGNSEAQKDLARLICAAEPLLAASVATQDLLRRCDAELMPDGLAPAGDQDWDRVVAQVNDAIESAHSNRSERK